MARASLSFKFRLLLLYIAAYLIFYSWPNFYPILPPKLLPLLSIDQAIPFLPWSFAVYLSDYLLALTVILMLTEKARFIQYAQMTFGVLIVCGIVFFIYPTVYPRPEYPTDPGPLVRFFMNVVCSLDQPTNCFPSHHVAVTSVATWNIRYRGPKVTALFILWSCLIFFSTLTTKQHYFVDILGGVVVALVVIYLNPKLFPAQRGAAATPSASL